MADIADIADKQNEKMLDAQIQAARSSGAYMPGPAKCKQCGYPNDRREQGWGICSDCAHEVDYE